MARGVGAREYALRMRCARLWPLLLLAACGQDRSAPAHGDVPAGGELNAYVLAALRAYPTDGTHGYHWPKDESLPPGAWRGNARALVYDGRTLSAAEPAGRCHCSGLTFEVFFDAWMAWTRATGRPERIRDLDLEGVRRLQRQWFGSPEDHSTLRTALVENGLGTQLKDWEQARPGDFVQLWRHDGSGHAAVFLAWERGPGDAYSGLRYWSTQKSTNGIGERIEDFGAGGHNVNWEELYLCRVGRP